MSLLRRILLAIEVAGLCLLAGILGAIILARYAMKKKPPY